MVSEFSVLENKHGRCFVRNVYSEVSSVPNVLGVTKHPASQTGGKKSRHPEDRPDSCSLDRGRIAQCSVSFFWHQV